MLMFTTVCAYCDAALRYSAQLAPCILVLLFAASLVAVGLMVIKLSLGLFARGPARK
jgi:hypothetical protein